MYHSDYVTQPGKYTLTLGSRQLPIVVNVPANAEADVTTVDNEAIGVALGGVKMEDKVNISNPDRDFFGWLTLILVLMLAAFECYIAWKFGHYRHLDVAGGGPLGSLQRPGPGIGTRRPADVRR